MRGEVPESRHRGHVVQVGPRGEVQRALGDPGTLVTLRSCVKPFSLVVLIESGAADDLGLTPAELAVMAGSHTGEDKHVRTLQAIFRRAGVSQAQLECGTRGAPLDERPALRLARDGEAPSPIRHNCSGYHAASILLSRFADWPIEGYTAPGHPSQVAVRETVARLFGRQPDALVAATDDCGLPTYAVTLLDVARAYLLLADPDGAAPGQGRASSAPALRRIRDAMMANPDLVGGTYEVVDTELMRRRPGLLVSKGGAEGLRGVGLLAGPGARGTVPAGLALRIEDGDGPGRASRAATLEALAQMGALDERDLRELARLHRPVSLAPDGSEAARSVPRFELAPLHELI
jgi:L-asparaginase II